MSHPGRFMAASWLHHGCIMHCRIMSTSWPHHGCIIAASWSHLGRIMAESWPPHCCIIAASLPHLGRIMTASWPPHGRPLGKSQQRRPCMHAVTRNSLTGGFSSNSLQKNGIFWDSVSLTDLYPIPTYLQFSKTAEQLCNWEAERILDESLHHVGRGVGEGVRLQQLP